MNKKRKSIPDNLRVKKARNTRKSSVCVMSRLSPQSLEKKQLPVREKSARIAKVNLGINNNNNSLNVKQEASNNVVPEKVHNRKSKQNETLKTAKNGKKNKPSSKTVNTTKKPSLKKVVNSAERIESCSPLVSKLRTRKFVKYAESSLESSQSEVADLTKKVPIYKQPFRDNEPIKRKKGDQYDFDSDSENYKKRKRQKHNDSDEYNKTIQNILKNVVGKTRIKERRRVFKDNQNIMLKKNDLLNHKSVASVSSNKRNEATMQEKEQMTVSNLKGKLQNVNDISLPNEDNVSNEVNDSEANNFFGFMDMEKPKSGQKIQIIGDIHLHPRKELNFTLGSPKFFGTCRPDANSTMLNNILIPWRFNDVNIKRNPHFITLKNSALPCINQDLVLDHNIVEKLDSTLDSTNDNSHGRIVIKKVPFQKPITDYLRGSIENKENVQVSLFECHQLSPIKNGKTTVNHVTPVKRRVLGERNDNALESQTSSTPVRNLSTSLDADEQRNFTNFGFEMSEDSVEVEESVMKNKDDRPFRFSININDKKYRGKQMKHMAKRSESPEATDQEDNMSDVGSEVEEVKLFEDLTNTQDRLEISDNIVFNRKKKSKKRDENKDNYKKRKDIRSKEEEEEAEKWAAAFNSMCEEVEQFPLEIE